MLFWIFKYQKFYFAQIFVISCLFFLGLTFLCTLVINSSHLCILLLCKTLLIKRRNLFFLSSDLGLTVWLLLASRTSKLDISRGLKRGCIWELAFSLSVFQNLWVEIRNSLLKDRKLYEAKKVILSPKDEAY